MAAQGLAGPGGILDGRWGMLRVMNGAAPEGLVDDLGKRWEFAATAIKPYASCRFTHGPVAAIAAAKFDPGRVEAIEIAAFRASVEVSDRAAPRDRAEAILSHQIAAALALQGRSILPSTYDAIDAETLALSRRVAVRHDAALDAAYPARWPHRITVSMKGGARVTLDSDRPPSADHEATLAKFRTLATPMLGANADQMISLVDRLESLPDARPLLQLLSPQRAEAA
jgi:2-methylcitrate dehydratase PrpD